MENSSPQTTDVVLHLSAHEYERAVELARDWKLPVDGLFHRALAMLQDRPPSEEDLEMLVEMNKSLDGFIDTIRENRISIQETLKAMDQRAAKAAESERAA